MVGPDDGRTAAGGRGELLDGESQGASGPLDPLLLAPFLDEVVTLVDRRGRVVLSLGPPAGLLGTGRHLGDHILSFAHPDDLPGLLALGSDALGRPPGWTADWEGRLRQADGSYARFRFAITRWAGPPLDGLVVRTRRWEGADDDRPSQVIAGLLESIGVALAVLDPYGEAVFVNQPASDLLGVERAELLGRGWRRFIGEEMAQLLDAQIEVLKSGARRSSTVVPWPERRCSDRARGESDGVDRTPGSSSVLGRPERRVEVRLEGHVVDGRLGAVLVLLEDVTSRITREEELETLAARDSLTGLLNRGAVLAALEEVVRRAADEVAVAFCDLDGFKAINDRFGHITGDEVLVGLARGLERALSERDMAGRLGGDEFLAVFVGRPGRTAGLARRLNEELCRAVPGIAAATPLSISVGVVRARLGESVTSLVMRADRAMYRAKRRASDAAPDRRFAVRP